LNVTTDSLFLFHPDPMWIYDLETLRFLAVNNAAVAKYGFSREEFLAMTIADIRPAEDLAALEKNVEAVEDGRDEAGVWRHCLKSGKMIYVDITGHTIEHEGRRTELIAARDVSRLVVADQMTKEALAREKAARQSSDTLARQFQKMFDNVPGMFLVFSPENLDVIAVSDEYLDAIRVTRKDVVGHNLFDALPPQADDRAHTRLRRSFDRVLTTGEPDLLEVQCFLLPPDGERLWVISCTPVTGSDHGLLYLILRMQDVTSAIDADPAARDGLAPESARIDLFAHTHALKSDNIRLAELATRLRTTQRLLNTGTWDYFPAEDRLEFSANTYGIYGTNSDLFGHRFEDYVALLHPDDRAAMRANFDAKMVSSNTHFTFSHRVLNPDGRIVHVHGIAEKTEFLGVSVLRGVVQDVTENVDAASALAQAKRMLEIAGTSAKFGAWRYNSLTGLAEWSKQTARIHDEPDGFSPRFADAIAYYVPEQREWFTHLARTCLEDGKPFDETFQINTAKGRRLSVRVTCEAERDETGDIFALNGSIQDISELVTVRRRAEESERLLEIAGRAVKLGGWRVSLTDQKVSWTDGVAAIHELPAGTPPTFRGGIDYFAPEEREDARDVFEACARDGVPFDNVRDLITVKGNRIRVRSIGVPVRDEAGRIVAVQGAMQDISELTAAQRKADDLSRRLAETLENIGDAFYTLDWDWRFTFLNTKAEGLLERTRETLIGRNLVDAFPEIAGSAFEIQYQIAFNTGATVRFEQFFAPLDRTFRVIAHPTPAGLAVYFSDITEERRRGEQLRLLDAAVGHINDIVIITEVCESAAVENSKIVYVNNAFERLTGFSRQEAIGQTPRILQGPKTSRSELDRIGMALARSTPVRAELINYTKSGQEYWLEIDIMPVVDESGTVTHFVGIQRDITGRRRAEEALRLSEARFRMIARSTGHAIWELNIAKGEEWWSDGLTAIFGHLPDPENKLPTVWQTNLHPDDEARVNKSLERLMSGSTKEELEQYRFRRADGSWANVEDRAFAIHDDEGRAIRVLGSIADISEKLLLEDRLRQSQKLEAVGQLTGGVAHDFNNLLTIIMGNTEMLQDRLDERHPLRRYADMSAMAADRAAELTNRLLAFSRKQALQPRIIDVNAVVSGIEDMLRRTLSEDIDIRISLGDGLWPVTVDLSQFESAILNLALNSRDAMPHGGALTIETANASLDEDYVSTELGLMSGEYAVITVSDTGQGIPVGQIDRVFEPFFTTKAIGEGTGLGLSMVYGFVKQTGGHIRIYSELNEGTTVKLYFPRFSGGPTPPRPEVDDTRILHGQETILVVEDDILILKQLMDQLAGLGYKVITASAGVPALAILRDQSDIDLLLTDVILPGGMNGRQIAEAAQLFRPDLKVLYTSGYSQNAIVHHGRLDRGVELLSKPYRRSELASKVRKVLDS